MDPYQSDERVDHPQESCQDRNEKDNNASMEMSSSMAAKTSDYAKNVTSNNDPQPRVFTRGSFLSERDRRGGSIASYRSSETPPATYGLNKRPLWSPRNLIDDEVGSDRFVMPSPHGSELLSTDRSMTQHIVLDDDEAEMIMEQPDLEKERIKRRPTAKVSALVERFEGSKKASFVDPNDFYNS